MRVLAGMLAPGCLLEKASVDEAFLDVTSMVEDELRRRDRGPEAAPTASDAGLAEGPGLGDGSQLDALAAEPDPNTAGYCSDAAADEGMEAGGGGGTAGEAPGAVPAWLLAEARQVCAASVVIGGPPQLLNEVDRRLVVGGFIAMQLRRAVRAQLDFTCSAGVATNKLLAKVGSARNKPDKQTLVLLRGVPDLMQDMPLGKLRGLGGKLGAALEQHFGATTAGQVQQLPLEQLQRHLGERTGLWVSQIVRGQCSEAVTPKDKPKSLLSCKSFEATRDLTELARWMTILAEELVQRCADDEAAHRRRARTLVLHYRGTGPRERSVRCAMPQHGREGACAATIAKACMEMLRRQPDALPSSRLAIAATEFDDPPAAGAKAITRFFTTAAAPSGAAVAVAAPPASTGAAAGAGATDFTEGKGPEQDDNDRLCAGSGQDDGDGCPCPLAPQSTAALLCPGGGGGDEPPLKKQRHEGQQPHPQQQSQRRHPHQRDGAGDGDGGHEQRLTQAAGWAVLPGSSGAGTRALAWQDDAWLQGRQQRQEQREGAVVHLQDGWSGHAGVDRHRAESAGGAGHCRSYESIRASGMGLQASTAAADGGEDYAAGPSRPVDACTAEGGHLEGWARAGGGGPGDPGGSPQPGGPGGPPSYAAAGDPDQRHAIEPSGQGGGHDCGDKCVDTSLADATGGGKGGIGGNDEQQRGGLDPPPNVDAADLVVLGLEVDLAEQRRILHDIELARLRSLGRAPGSGPGGGGTGGGRRAVSGGAGRGRGRGQGATDKGQTRLTVLLQPRGQKRT